MHRWPLAARLEEEMRQKQAHEEALATKEKERRRKEKLATGKAKLSFNQDEVCVWGGHSLTFRGTALPLARVHLLLLNHKCSVVLSLSPTPPSSTTTHRNI